MQEKTRRPQRFDAFRLAAGGGELHGSVVPARLPRLEDRIAEGQGRIDWTIRGSADALGRPAIVVSVKGAVPLECQRCLRPLEQSVEQSTTLLLARNDTDLVHLDEISENEVVLADAPLDPVALVEDELLLSLPFAPRHDADCAPGTAAVAD